MPKKASSSASIPAYRSCTPLIPPSRVHGFHLTTAAQRIRDYAAYGFVNVLPIENGT